MIDLPIDEHLDQICSEVLNSDIFLLSSTPGSGKTTRVPVALSQTLPEAIWVLEPRRIAARSAAQRIAFEQSWSLGQQVGYQVRFDNRCQKNSKIIFMTEAIASRHLLDNPQLKGVSCIVLDEFHERSIHTDLAFSLFRELQMLERPDLKIVLMSATLGIESLISKIPNSSHIHVETPIFPIEIKMSRLPMNLTCTPAWVDRVVDTIADAVSQNTYDGDCLVFLPGRSEINRVERALFQRRLEDFEILQLHGQLPMEEQSRVLQRNLNSTRRIILSTNVAESSVTVDGVNIVVDSGLEKTNELHSRTGFPSLELSRISRSSAVQRAGRAGRQKAGLVVQMWNSNDAISMAEEKKPELHRTELIETTLLLAGLKISKPESLEWIDPAPLQNWKKAQDFLVDADCLNSEFELTSTGREILAWPVSVRWGACLARARKLKADKKLFKIIATAESGLRSTANQSIDLLERSDSFSQSAHYSDASKFLKQLQNSVSWETKSEADLSEILWAGFSDRLTRCRQGRQGTAKMVNSIALELPRNYSLKSSPFFYAIDVQHLSDNEPLVSTLIEIPEVFIERFVKKLADSKTSVELLATGRWIKKRTLEYRGCPVSAVSEIPADPDDFFLEIVKWAEQNWTEITSRNESLKDWMLREAYYARKLGQPTLIDEKIRRTFLELCSIGQKENTFFFAKDLSDFLEQALGPSLSSEMNRACPRHLTSASGRNHRLAYRDQLPPLLEIRIQDAFCWKSSPMIMNEAIVIDLLAPNGRPAQRTQDLANFWKTSYKEVRKELRARYPKHSWPEEV